MFCFITGIVHKKDYPLVGPINPNRNSNCVVIFAFYESSRVFFF